MCDGTVEIYLGNERFTKLKCGSTNHFGRTSLCDDCMDKALAKYPQGWDNVPGDRCEHGTYIGGPSGPDHICGECESN